MIIGIKYQNLFPEPILTLPNGMTVFQSKLLPTSKGALACIGGPVEALHQFSNNIGVKNTISYMSNLIQNVKKYPPRLEAFPSSHKSYLIDKNIPGINKFLEDV